MGVCLLVVSLLAAIYNYQGKVDRGLQLDVGDAVQIYEECSGEFYA